MAKVLSVAQFFKMFPDDDKCLEHLFVTRYGRDCACVKCGEVGKFRKLSGIPAYTCNCGHHIHPMAGTPFQDSRTPLQKWFYAIYLFTTSRHGVPAKELQRQLGVTYKCAWRIGHEIRKYMDKVNGDGPLSGTVEIDEAKIGGRAKGKVGAGVHNKSVVIGMVERGGKLVAKVVPDVKVSSLHPVIKETIVEGSEVHTDELGAYRTLSELGYKHKTIAHTKGEYVRGNVHTNSVEGFWGQLKRSIRGTHISVSKQHMPKYLGEFSYRYNMRKKPELMFDRLIKAF